MQRKLCAMNILLTRPAVLNQPLAKKLQGKGFNTIDFPVMEISPPTDGEVLDNSVQALRKAIEAENNLPMLIFTSPSSVSSLFVAYPDLALKDCNLFAIGAGTAKVLKKYTEQNVSFPEEANSQELLALLLQKNVVAKNFIIFTGENGNTTLQDGLAEAGAMVEVVFTHQRVLPTYKNLLWQAKDVDMTICTSAQALHYLQQLIDRHGLSALYDNPLIVITAQMQQLAQQIGFKSAIIVADGASDAELLVALSDYDRMKHE